MTVRVMTGVLDANQDTVIGRVMNVACHGHTRSASQPVYWACMSVDQRGTRSTEFVPFND